MKEIKAWKTLDGRIFIDREKANDYEYNLPYVAKTRQLYLDNNIPGTSIDVFLKIIVNHKREVLEILKILPDRAIKK